MKRKRSQYDEHDRRRDTYRDSEYRSDRRKRRRKDERNESYSDSSYSDYSNGYSSEDSADYGRRHRRVRHDRDRNDDDYQRDRDANDRRSRSYRDEYGRSTSRRDEERYMSERRRERSRERDDTREGKDRSGRQETYREADYDRPPKRSDQQERDYDKRGRDYERNKDRNNDYRRGGDNNRGKNDNVYQRGPESVEGGQQRLPQPPQRPPKKEGVARPFPIHPSRLDPRGRPDAGHHMRQREDRGRRDNHRGGGRNAERERLPELMKPGKENEAPWERRQRIREQRACSPIWQRSPSPPPRLEDRLEIGVDDRKRKEMRKQRKEDRRRRREARRARESEEDKKEPSQAPGTEPERLVSNADDLDEDEAVLGPAPPPAKEKSDNLHYGKDLMPGEGTKLAAFVQEGERIPRRGEIGMTSNEIDDFEKQGYVMSGSRNVRMEAVRIRKENQVYSAEELAALSQFSREERQVRDDRMMNRMRMMVEAKYARENKDVDGEEKD